MTRASNEIPTLPAISSAARRRRKSYTPFIVVVVALCLVTLVVLALVKSVRDSRARDQALVAADRLLENSLFREAESRYREFYETYEADSRAARARAGEEMCRLMQSVAGGKAPAQRVTQAAEEIYSRPEAEGVVKLAWPKLISLGDRASKSLLGQSEQTVTRAEWESAQHWRRWLQEQTQKNRPGAESLVLADYADRSALLLKAIEDREQRQDLLAALKAVRDQEDPATLERAFAEIAAWREDGHTADPETALALSSFCQVLQHRVRFEPPPDQGQPAPSIQQVPLDAYLPLMVRQPPAPPSPGPGPVTFARVKDLCFGLDAGSGEPKWALRVGYDAPLPSNIQLDGKNLLLISWFSEGSRPVVSLFDESAMEPVWSWAAPEGLAGQPRVLGSFLMVACQSGSLWQLDLKTGMPSGVARIPEHIDGPPSLREDGGGLCVMGRNQCLYLIDGQAEQPYCSRAMLAYRRGDTVRCETLWVPPYVVIFENGLADETYVRAIHTGGDETAATKVLRLKGRLWGTPVLDGSRLCVVTDRWQVYCLGLDPGESGVSPYIAASCAVDPPDLATPVIPRFTSTPDYPLVSLSNELHAYRLDQSRQVPVLLPVWNQQLPAGFRSPSQPLQLVGSSIIAGYGSDLQDGMLLEAYNAKNGNHVWRTTLGASVRRWGFLREELPLVTTVGSGQILLLQRGVPDWNARSLGVSTSTSELVPDRDARLVIWVGESGKSIERIGTDPWEKLEPIQLQDPVASPLTLWDDRRETSDGSSGEGVWAVFLTQDPAIEMTGIYPDMPVVRKGDLPSEQLDGVWQWPPVVFDADNIIAVHPAGTICRFSVARDQDIAYLALTGTRRAPRRLLSAPVRIADQLLCVLEDRSVSLVDPVTLKSTCEYESSDRLEKSCVIGGQVYFATETEVKALRLRNEKLVELWSRKLGGKSWLPVGRAKDDLLVANPQGQVVALRSDTGDIIWSHSAGAPLSADPVLVADRLYLATVDGGVFAVPYTTGDSN